jgi:putative solute:sodium symporter small subunit
MSNTKNKLYWRKNLKYLAWLLSVWLLVSFGAAILFADYLNQFHLGGFPLGFWFAQQGAIYVFVLLIFIYVFLMNRLDKKFDVDEK